MQVRWPVLVLVVVFSAVMPPAHAATVIHVTTTHDALANDGRCSLREAITTADTGFASGPARGECQPGTTILLKKKVYTLTLDSPGEDLNLGGDLDITASMKIVGRRGTKVEQRTLDRIFDIASGQTVELDKLRIINGRAPAGRTITGEENAEGGGAIRNAGTLTINRSTITQNRTGDGAPAQGPDLANGSGGDGGGILSSGSLTLNRVVVSSNTAGNGGGGTPVNSGLGGAGGGIFASGTLNINRSTITGNVAGNSTQPGALSTDTTGGDGGGGGGISAAATGTITGSTITHNVSGNGGAGQDPVIPGTNGSDGGNGGNGGGVDVEGGNLTIVTSTLAANQTGNGGRGGNGADNPGSSGGNGGRGGNGGDGAAIFTQATLTLDRSTIFGGTTGDGGAGGGAGTGAFSGALGTPGGQGSGGGVAVGGTGVFTATDDTLSGNTSSGGGGVSNEGTSTLDNVTVAGNSATVGGGGIFALTGTFTLQNSIVAANTSPLRNDCFAVTSVVGNDFNFMQDDSNCAGIGGTDIIGQSPKLGRLRRNGGPTMTRLPRARSPVVNHGNPAAPGSGSGACQAIDQRGRRRGRTRCDIGAVEKK